MVATSHSQSVGKRTLSLVVSVVLISYAVFLVQDINAQKRKYQWDFKTFYFASQANALGLNPYDKDSLDRLAREKIGLLYHYPPYALWFFSLLSQFSYRTAYSIYLLFKCALLGCLLILWSKVFLRKESGLLFFIFCFLAFNSTIYVDLVAGNISIIEQFFLWMGFYFLLKRKLPLFCLFIILAASFKLTPAAFLLVLLFVEEKRKYLYFLGSGIAFGSIQMASYLTSPWSSDFIRSMGFHFEEHGWSNPTTLGLIKDSFSLFEQKTGMTVAGNIQVAVFGLLAAVIVFLTWRAFSSLRSRMPEEKDRILIFLGCLTFALISLRFKDYAYILLIVPAFYALQRFSTDKGRIFLFILFCLSTVRTANLPIFVQGYNLVWDYYSLLLAFGLWILYLAQIQRTMRLPYPKYNPVFFIRRHSGFCFCPHLCKKT